MGCSCRGPTTVRLWGWSGNTRKKLRNSKDEEGPSDTTLPRHDDMGTGTAAWGVQRMTNRRREAGTGQRPECQVQGFEFCARSIRCHRRFLWLLFSSAGISRALELRAKLWDEHFTGLASLSSPDHPLMHVLGSHLPDEELSLREGCALKERALHPDLPDFEAQVPHRSLERLRFLGRQF